MIYLCKMNLYGKNCDTTLKIINYWYVESYLIGLYFKTEGVLVFRFKDLIYFRILT